MRFSAFCNIALQCLISAIPFSYCSRLS